MKSGHNTSRNSKYTANTPNQTKNKDNHQSTSKHVRTPSKPDNKNIKQNNNETKVSIIFAFYLT